MPLEAGTYILDLNINNPLSSDKKKVGDDHLRLIKSILRNTFPDANRAFRFNKVTIVAADAVLSEPFDMQTIFVSASANITLPTPTYAGWKVTLVNSGTGTVYVFPPAGTINGLAKIRLSVPNDEQTFVWTGTTFIRLHSAGTPGALIPFAGAVPTGYALSQGQSLLRADHPELFAAWSTTWGAADGTHFNAPDTRDRFLVGAGSSYALAATGGEATHALTTAELAVHNHGITQNPHTHGITSGTTGNLQVGVDTGGGTSPVGTGAAPSATAANADITINNNGSGTAHENRPPYLGMNHIFRLC